jgi:hypothetical protein
LLWRNKEPTEVASLGTYEFKAYYDFVYLNNFTGEATGSRWIAADALKFTASLVYLPDVKNKDGWFSWTTIRNNGLLAAQVGVNYYNPDGTRPAINYTWTEPVAGNGSTNILPPTDFSGSAVIVASEDVAVVVRNTSSNGVTTYTGVPVVSSGAGWDQPGATVYVPAALNQWGWVSTLYLQNTSAAAATADIRFYDIYGNCSYPLEDVPIAPNGRAAVNLAGITQLGNFSGSAVVSADQALAVTVRQDNANGAGYSDYNAFSSGAAGLYLPSLLKGYYNWNSAFQVQNVDSAVAQVRRSYYYADGSDAAGGGTADIDPGACAVYAADGMPSGVDLSASVVSLNGRRIGGICNLSRSSGAGDIGGSYNLPGH